MAEATVLVGGPENAGVLSFAASARHERQPHDHPDPAHLAAHRRLAPRRRASASSLRMDRPGYVRRIPAIARHRGIGHRRQRPRVVVYPRIARRRSRGVDQLRAAAARTIDETFSNVPFTNTDHMRRGWRGLGGFERRREWRGVIRRRRRGMRGGDCGAGGGGGEGDGATSLHAGSLIRWSLFEQLSTVLPSRRNLRAKKGRRRWRSRAPFCKVEMSRAGTAPGHVPGKP
jgi:hypothetical protein